MFICITACLLADSLFKSLFHQGLRAFHCFHARLGCYRLERKLPGGVLALPLEFCTFPRRTQTRSKRFVLSEKIQSEIIVHERAWAEQEAGVLRPEIDSFLSTLQIDEKQPIEYQLASRIYDLNIDLIPFPTIIRFYSLKELLSPEASLLLLSYAATKNMHASSHAEQNVRKVWTGKLTTAVVGPWIDRYCTSIGSPDMAIFINTTLNALAVFWDKLIDEAAKKKPCAEFPLYEVFKADFKRTQN